MKSSTPRSGTGIRFGPFRLLSRQGPLLRDGQAMALPASSLELLWLLALHQGQIVSRRTLMESLWARDSMSDEALTFHVSQLRRALGDDPRHPRWVQAVYGKGLRLATLSAYAPGSDSGEDFFVGREAEMDFLLSSTASSNEGQRQLVFLCGEPGMGKSTLLEHYSHSVAQRREPPLVLRGHCAERERGAAAFAPLLEILSQWLTSSRPENAIGLLREHALPWLLNLPGVLSPEECEEVRRKTSGVGRQAHLLSLATFFEQLSLQMPLALIIEDLHWSDRSTLEWLELMARRPGSARLILLLSCRLTSAVVTQHPVRSLHQKLTVSGLAKSLDLAYLGHADTARYLAHRLGANLASATLVDQVYRRSSGHALFLARITDFLSEAGTNEAAAHIPKDLRELIEVQIGLLARMDRRLLETASLIGAEFTASTLAHALNEPLASVEDHCDRLTRLGHFIVDQGLAIWPDGSICASFRFRHALYEQVLRERVPSSEARPLLLRIARYMETAYGDASDSISLTLANYYEGAGHAAHALNNLVIAGRMALERVAPAEAKQAALRGLRLIAAVRARDARETLELQLQTIMVTALHNEFGYSTDATRPHLQRIQALISSATDSRIIEPALFHVCLSALSRYEFDVVEANAAELEARGITDGRLELQLVGLAFSSVSKLTRGVPREAISRASRAVALAHSHAKLRKGVLSYQSLDTAFSTSALSRWYLGRPETALRIAALAYGAVERLGNPYSLCVTYALGAPTILMLGREWQRALPECMRCVEMSQSYGSAAGLFLSRSLRAIASAMLGVGEDPIIELAQLIDHQLEIGSRINMPFTLVMHAELSMDRGDMGGARRSLDRALGIMNGDDARLWYCEALRMDARWLRLEHGQHHDDARQRLKMALDSAQKRGIAFHAMRAACDMIRHAGSPEEALQAGSELATLCKSLREGLTGPDYRDARALLDVKA